MTKVHLLCWFMCVGLVTKGAAASTGSLELGLRGGWVARGDGQRELTAMLSLSLPMQRALRPKLAPRVAEPAPAKPAEPAKPEPPRRVALVVVTPALAQATLRAAQRASGRARAAERFGSLASRARASAALPELRLRAARTTDESLRLAPTTSDPYRYTQAGGVSIALEAQATWRLDRAVFAEEEIQVEHLRRLRARQDARLVDEVLRALFAWQRAVSGAVDPELPAEEQELASLRVVEAEVRLDVLTGGWFSARAPALKQNALSRRRRSE